MQKNETLKANLPNAEEKHNAAQALIRISALWLIIKRIRSGKRKSYGTLAAG